MAGTRGTGGLSHLTGVPPSDRCPPPPVAPAMASSSPQSQPTIAFPRTRSARRLAAPSAKSDPEAPALRPSQRSKASGPAGPGQATPDKRSSRGTAQPLSATAQPLSPRKRLGESLRRNPPGMAGDASPFPSRRAAADRWVWSSCVCGFTPISGGRAAPTGFLGGAEA